MLNTVGVIFLLGIPLAVFIFPILWVVIASRERTRGHPKLAVLSLLCAVLPLLTFGVSKATQSLDGGWLAFALYIPVNISILLFVTVVSANARKTPNTSLKRDALKRAP